jgi:hypothetical protein
VINGWCCLPSIFGQHNHDQRLPIAERTPRSL